MFRARQEEGEGGEGLVWGRTRKRGGSCSGPNKKGGGDNHGVLRSMDWGWVRGARGAGLGGQKDEFGGSERQVGGSKETDWGSNKQVGKGQQNSQEGLI